MSKNYIKGYADHGALVYPYSDKDASGNCRFCDDQDHFQVNMHNGQYRCLKCENRGNLYTFLRQVWRRNYASTTDKLYRQLSVERGISAKTLQRFNWAWDPLCLKWTLPISSYVGASTENTTPYWRITNLRSWVLHDGKHKLFGTTTCKSHVFNAESLLARKTLPRRIVFNEGEWDALALLDSDPPEDTAILGVPGAGFSLAAWISAFPVDLSSCELVLLYDHDRSGILGQLRFLQKKPGARVLLWDNDKPVGHDVRDLVLSGLPSSEVWQYIESHLV